MEALLTHGPVLIIGTGLLGTSIALRLRRGGVVVHLQDSSPVAAGLAHDLDAGSLEPVDNPAIVVVAVPPDVTARVVARALTEFPSAVVTDVASVKATVADALASHPQVSRYVGSHPMAGRERSGAIAADADLFVGRPWVIAATSTTDPQAVKVIRSLATDMGAAVVTMSPENHDHAVAVVSHVPQLMSSLVAATLESESAYSLELAGQGLRDVTRIAHSDPMLWTSIVNGNRNEIARVLRGLYERLGLLVDALESDASQTSNTGLHIVSGVLADGNTGVSRIPGKHGGAPAYYAEVIVLVPDKPGELGRLFSEIGDIGINIEDFSLEHSAAQSVGRALVMVEPAKAVDLESGLSKRGWRVVTSSGK